MGAASVSWDFPLARAKAVDFLELTKPRITGMVLVSMLAGFSLGAGKAFPLTLLLHALVGTALVAAGSNALNMAGERRRDLRMLRTQNRPIPSGRLSKREGAMFGTLTSLVGIGYLVAFVNVITGALALATFVIYLILYTPLKKITRWSLLVGAVAGAVPPVGGWVAVRGSIAPEAWCLFLILFFWQLPHFLSLSWVHRRDYDRGGFRTFPQSDPSGGSAGFYMVLFGVALIPASLLLPVLGAADGVYALGAAVLGLAYLAMGIRFSGHRTDADARRVFLGSVIYLPALFAFLLFDKLVG
jgi:protoheme IX farnesyltransferase